MFTNICKQFYYLIRSKSNKMESFLVNKEKQKRKKLKTRKNLDAIRQKARQSFLHTDNNKENKIDTNSKKKKFPAKASIYVTSNRLTLFKKAVSSDTVSRKMISEEKNKKKVKNIIKEVENNVMSNFLSKVVQPLKERIIVLSDKSSNQSVSHVSDEEHTQDNVISDTGVGTPNSIILFSPFDRNEQSDTSENLEINTQQSNDKSSDSSPINNLHSQNNFYENFMNEIPKYIQKTAPALLKTDFLTKYKKSLRNLCFEEGILIDEGSSPLQYDFTSKYSEHETNFRGQLDEMSYSCPVSQSELSSSPSISTESNTSIRKSSSPLSFIIPDSPEYVYYPHKLNQ